MGVSCSLGERWVFCLKDNLVMLIINMLNRLLFYTLPFESAFFPLAQNEFRHKTIHTKSGFSPIFIYSVTRFIFVWNVRILPCLKLVQRGKTFQKHNFHFGCKISNALAWLVEQFNYNLKALLKCVLVWFGFVLCNKTLCFQCFAKKIS